MSPAAIILYAVLTGLALAPALVSTFVFNFRRYRRTIRRDVHPMLVREGLRGPDDPWEPSGAAGDGDGPSETDRRAD